MNFSKFAKPYTWMSDHRLWKQSLPDIAKHLPPSSAHLKLLDIGCGSGVTLRGIQELRPDIIPIGLDPAWGMVALGKSKGQVHYLQGDGYHLPFPDNSLDAVLSQRVYYILPDKSAFLAEIMRVLRPGGRMILVDPMHGKSPWQAWREIRYGKAVIDLFAWHLAAQRIGGLTLEGSARTLEAAGFARILTEPILNGWAILSRGEKPYADGMATSERVKIGASDSDLGTVLQGEAIQNVNGRFIHLLIRQTPNKPAWAMQPDEPIQWEAVAAEKDGQVMALAFTALPKAVSMMQTAIMEGVIQDVNKVGKFSKTTATTWDFPIILNPTLEAVRPYLSSRLLKIDHLTAQTGDE